jgi:hypothetical protein
MQSMKVTVPHSQVKQAKLMLLQIDKIRTTQLLLTRKMQNILQLSNSLPLHLSSSKNFTK